MTQMSRNLSMDTGKARRNGATPLLSHLEIPSLVLHGEVPPPALQRAG